MGAVTGSLEGTRSGNPKKGAERVGTLTGTLAFAEVKSQPPARARATVSRRETEHQECR